MSSAWAPTYEFYRDEYKGQAPEGVFDAELPGACAHVDWLIGFNDVTDGTATAYKRAVCAAVEAFAVYGGAASGGFTIGSFSASAPAGSKTAKDIATEDAVRELGTSGLLWQGACR